MSLQAVIRITGLGALLCKLNRHDWRIHEPQESLGITYPPFLFCPRCKTTCGLLEEPPMDHPECMTVVLPKADEWWLAELADELWPGDEEDFLRPALTHLHSVKEI